MLGAQDFFDLKDNPFAGLFEGCAYVWDGLKRLKSYIDETINPNVSEILKDGPTLSRTVILHDGRMHKDGFELDPGDAAKGTFVVRRDGEVLPGASVIYAGASLMDERIQIGKGSVIEPGALIKGPSVIGDKTEIRQGAYIRGQVLVGNRCVVGHATEMKNAVLLGGSQAGHFAYLGDSILGAVNLGAGTKLANLKIVEGEIVLNIGGERYKTGLRKFGAVLGDGVETGCNSVTAPGTLLGKNVLVYPNCTARGFHPAGTIVKLRQNQIILQRRD
ncbi:MAG: glucose-1-phosphate thymidylyltransferase [Candidatus Aminicenantes bacterium]|nr:glucose-1-phosphate thymidylyltransferase [Candidatus Aminicenantes bacterium]